jgi:CubicO group peptidase (beta-lactamase class C family)
MINAVRRSVGVFLAATSSLAISCLVAAASPSPEQSLDAIFQQWNRPDTPGCVVGIEPPGATPLIKSYGSADLEGGISNSESTVFEAGSASKQFTAAAVLMLADRGQLALSDSIIKYLPELPPYAAQITIEELLGHTSGLRDWGEVEAMAGWPRTSRIYNLDDVLAITARQKSLNYRPGTAYSYTNTGFSLLAIIVARVSRQSLAEFTREQLFVPLGMTHTQWRDDFTRLVKGRAIAYQLGEAGYHQQMPFENVYGHGALLTTVGDLLRWNDALSTGKLGEYVTHELVRQTRLENGKSIAYARGLFISSYRGALEIAHSGATAGYRAWLGRYPDQQLSIALLCNAAEANTTALAHALADLFLNLPALPEPESSVQLSAAQLAALAGLYVDRTHGAWLRLNAAQGVLQLSGGGVLSSVTPSEFRAGSTSYQFSGGGHLMTEGADGGVGDYLRTQPWQPTTSQLAAFTGSFRSEEALASYDLQVRKDRLVMTPADRRGHPITLKPLAPDTFEAPDIGLVHFSRNSADAVTELEMRSARVYSLRFQRAPAR